MRSRAAVLGGFAFLLLALSLPAAAEPYAADPHGLVPFKDTAQSVYTQGTDTWEVWVCDVPGHSVPITPSGVVAGLAAEMSPYFEWLSGGDYTLSFVVGGTVTSEDDVSANLTSPEALFAPGCETAVADASTRDPHGAIIVVDAGFDEGYATAGAVCPEAPFTGCTKTYPDNARRAVLGAATVTTVAPFVEPQWITVAHELGHAINWAHSYGGLTQDPDTSLISRYDNPMDVMSGGMHTGLPIGAIGYHRYAAGWIDPTDVVVHRSGSAIYQLAAIGASGTQMVAIPSGEPSHFFTLDARRRTSYDAKLPKWGVEVYEVDQRREVACTLPAEWPSTWPCFATLIGIHQTPAVEGLTGTAHVLGIDETLNVGGFTVEVVAASTNGFSVRIAERESGTFVDDDGNLHEANIEAIATRGITNGCNPPANDRYCPSRSVTRAEMAAFLIRALGEEDNLPAYQGYFPDVPAGAWYTGFVERLFELGITTGRVDGTYDPAGQVSRAEMAAFLVRGFGPDPLPQATGVFTDIPSDAWYIAHAEALYDLGITRGCSTNPLRYCPADPVLRDQMASFIARVLGIDG